jgi:hypothetical protein
MKTLRDVNGAPRSQGEYKIFVEIIKADKSIQGCPRDQARNDERSRINPVCLRCLKSKLE